MKVSFIHVLVYFLQSLFLHTLFIFKTSLNLWYNLVITLHINVRYIERSSCSYAHDQTKESWMQDKHDHYLLHLFQVSSAYLCAKNNSSSIKELISNNFESVYASVKHRKKLKSDLKEKNSWELSLMKIQSLMCIKFTLNFIIDDKQSTSTLSFNENDHRRNKKRTLNMLSMLSNSQHDSSHVFIDFKIKSRSMKSMNSSFYDWQRREDDHHDSSYIWSESIQRKREISTVAHKNIMW